MPEFHFCLRVREKGECHKANTAHVVWIRIHKTEGCPIWSVNYCHAEGAEELLKSWLWIATPTPSSPLLSFFFFWVQTHVDHHAFLSFFHRRLHSWPEKSPQLVFIITLPHSWQQDEILFSTLFGILITVQSSYIFCKRPVWWNYCRLVSPEQNQSFFIIVL